MREMTSKQRMEAAVRFEEPDRVPVWIIGGEWLTDRIGMPYPDYCRDAENLAKANIHLVEKYKMDGVWPWPDVLFMHEGWGTKTKWFSDKAPIVTDFPLKKPEDYEKLQVLDPYKDGRMPVVIKAVKILSDKIGKNATIITGHFTALAASAYLRGFSNSMKDFILYPDLVHKGLKIVNETLVEFNKAIVEAGATGVFVHTARYDYRVLTRKHIREFGIKYDVEILEELKKAGVPALYHFCGPEPMIDMIVEDYPHRHGAQWWDKGTGLTLNIAKQKFGKKICLICGLDHTKTVPFGTPEDVEREVASAIRTAAPGGGFILSGGCEIPPGTPDENLFSVIKAVEKYGKYPIK